MASGAVHERYLNLFWIIIIPLGGILYLSSGFIYLVFLYFNFALTGISSPDLDHSMMTKDEHDAKRRFKKMSLAFLFPKKLFPTAHRMRFILSHFNLGVLGVLFVMWSQMYEYISSVFGGHRSWFSHGILIGTVTRMAWFNTPFAWIIFTMINHAVANWGYPTWDELHFRFFYMDIWLRPYLVTQFISWFIGDLSHLLLDTFWAKGRLYGFEKYGDKRSAWLKIITNRMRML